MPSTPSPIRPSDLGTGAASVVILLALAFGLHLPFWLALLAAGLVYAGLTLLRRPPAVEAPAPPSPASLLAELTALSQRIASHAVRTQLGALVTQARALLNYLQSQPASEAQWQDYVRDCLESAVAGTRQFAQLSPYLTEPTDPALVKYTGFLATLTETLGGVYKKLVGEDTANFATQIDTYKNTLHDINQVYLGADRPE